MAHILADMIPTSEHAATWFTARKHPILLRQLPLHHHVSTQQCLILLPAEAPRRNNNSAIPTRPSVANLLTSMPSAGQHPLAWAATGHRCAAVRTPPHNDLLPTGAGPVRCKCLAGRARSWVALQDTDVRAPGGISILPLGAKGFRPLKRLGAGLAAGVGSEEVVVGGLSPAPTEAGVCQIAGRGVIHGLASRTAPGRRVGVRCRGGVGGGCRGAHPLANAGEVEDGEAAVAGPDGRRPPNHVVADHALHRAAGELVLDLLHQLRHRPIAPSRRRGHRRRGRRARTGGGGGRRRGSLPLRRRPAAMATRVAVLLLMRSGAAMVARAAVVLLVMRRGPAMEARVVVLLLRRAAGAAIVVVPVIGTARAPVGRAGLRGRGREGQDWGAGGVGARGRGGGAGAPHGAGGGGHGSSPAAPIDGGLHAAGRKG
jgi:hypothetical protein